MSWLSHELFIPLQWCYISKWSAVCLLGKRRAKNVVFHTRILIGTRGLADIVHQCKEFLASHSHSPHASQNEAILATVFRLVETFTSQIRLLGEVWVLKPCNGIMRVKCCQTLGLATFRYNPNWSVRMVGMVQGSYRNGTKHTDTRSYWPSPRLILYSLIIVENLQRRMSLIPAPCLWMLIPSCPELNTAWFSGINTDREMVSHCLY